MLSNILHGELKHMKEFVKSIKKEVKSILMTVTNWSNSDIKEELKKEIYRSISKYFDNYQNENSKIDHREVQNHNRNK